MPPAGTETLSPGGNTTKKAPACGPVIITFLTRSGAFELLVSVASIGSVPAPTFASPKSSTGGVTIWANATPVPAAANETVPACGSSLVTVTIAVREPSAIGLKMSWYMMLFPGAIVAGSIGVTSAKSLAFAPVSEMLVMCRSE